MLPDTVALTSLSLPVPSAGKALLWNSSANALVNSTDDFNDIVTDATAQAVIATTQAGIATTQAGLANTARIAAELAETNAETAQGLAEDARDLAQGYAAAANVDKIVWQGAWSAGSYDESDAVEHNGSSWIATTTTTEEPSGTATDWDVLALKGTDGSGAGDVSSDTATSVDSELALFKNTTGKLIKRATGSGYVKTASGVYSNVTTIPIADGGLGFIPSLSGNANKVIGVNAGETALELQTVTSGMTNPMSAAGDIIYGGASGAPTRLAIGTAGQVPRVNTGATALEYYTPSAGALTLIGTSSVSANRYWDFTSLFDASLYSGYKIHFYDWRGSSSAAGVSLFFSSNNGSTWVDTFSNSTPSVGYIIDLSSTSMRMSANLDIVSGADTGYRIQLMDDDANLGYSVWYKAFVMNALRFDAQSGQTQTGSAYVYGYKKS